MKVLVTAASRHGGTAELATELGARLRELVGDPSVQIDVRAMGEVSSVRGYDAVVLGSAVYLGRWLAEGRDFVAAHSVELHDVPVWLFSSGPVGEPAMPDEEHPVDLTAVLAHVTPVSQRTFAGRIDRDSLGFAERMTVRALHVPTGDFRDWAAVRRWAADIAGHLTAAAPPTTPQRSTA